MLIRTRGLTAVALVLGMSSTVFAAREVPRYGIAGLYPGDVGIASDTSVVFVENFETGEIPVNGERWTEVSNKDGQVLSIVADSVPGSPGRRSLMMTATKGHDTGGHLWKLLDRKYDQLYLRFYCKFAQDAPYVHHFVHMSGKTSTNRYPEGNAGSRPDGYDRFSTSIDLIRSNANPPGTWHFYSYWSEMHSWQTGAGVPDGRDNPYYGNLFGPAQPVQANRGEWQCVELMIKLNSAPDRRDGEQAFWIDGVLVDHWKPGSHVGRWYGDRFRVYGSTQYQGSATRDSIPLPFEGFLWTKTEQLKINIIDIQYYLASVFEQNWLPADSTIPYNGNVARVQFDDIVVATKYIGPVAADAWSRFDFDGDGRKGVGDVHRMLQLRAADRNDMRADYDGNGRPGVMDALRMLLDIIRE